MMRRLRPIALAVWIAAAFALALPPVFAGWQIAGGVCDPVVTGCCCHPADAASASAEAGCCAAPDEAHCGADSPAGRKAQESEDGGRASCPATCKCPCGAAPLALFALSPALSRLWQAPVLTRLPAEEAGSCPFVPNRPPSPPPRAA